MRVWGIGAAIVLGVAATATAGPLDLKQVSAGAKWMVHFDVDAMRQSTLVQRAYDKCVNAFPNAEARLRETTDLVEHLGMDLTRDLHGLTAYGMKVGQLDGVFLVDANVDQKMLLEKADQAPDHKVTPHGAYQIHSWIDAQGKKHEHPMSGAFYKPSVLVFAPTVELVAAALDVLDGKSPALAGKPSPLAAAPPAGTMFLIRAVGLADAKLPWKSPLVTQSEVFGITVGEQDAKVLAEGKLATKSKETAEQVKSIVDGARSMAELQHGNDADAAKVIKMFKVSMADKTVKVEFSGPVDEIWVVAEKAAEEIVKHHKKHEAGQK
jgi:hypothetical protein